jgi:hypothetical protein
MFAVLLSPDESGMLLPSEMRKIAEYSVEGTRRGVVLVELTGACGLGVLEIERCGRIAVLPADGIKEGFDLARSVIERRAGANVSCRRRSKNR